MDDQRQQPTPSVKQLIDMACAYADISTSELARRIGWTRQLMHSRLKTGKLSYDEWQRVAEAMGANVKITFEFPDGKIIE